MNSTRRNFLTAVGVTAVIPGTALGQRAFQQSQHAVHTIQMSSRRGNVFDPVGLLVQPGDTVVWNLESGAHSTTAYENRIPESADTWDSGILSNQGETFSHTFTVEGTYDYYCLPHRSDGMVGRIVVGSPGGPAEERPVPDGSLPASSQIVERSSITTRALQNTQGIRITYDGTVAPGRKVTLTATRQGNPVPGANVYVRDGDGIRRLAGRTNQRGQITVTVPSTGDLNVKIRKGELEGELEVEPSGTQQQGIIRLALEGDVAPGNTVTIIATRNGRPVSGASVFVKDGNGDRVLVGRTNEQGRISVEVPASGDKAGELNVKVRKGELEGELERE